MRTRSPAIDIDRTVNCTLEANRLGRIPGYSMEVRDKGGRLLGEVGLGNRKDIRNAVEAARKSFRLGEDYSAQPRSGSLLLGGEFVTTSR